MTTLTKPRKLTPKQAKKALENQIEACFNKQGATVDIMDIGNIFKAGEDAAAAGTSVEDAVIAAVAKYRKD